jgi:hypothetical protein
MRRRTPWKRASAAAAPSTGTPAWRAASIAASALSALCAPSSSQRTSATGTPACTISNRE